MGREIEGFPGAVFKPHSLVFGVWDMLEVSLCSGVGMELSK